MSAFSTIPLNFDPHFIRERAGIVDHFGYVSEGDHTRLVYQVDQFDRVQAAITSYPVARLEVDLPVKLAELAELRRQKIEQFVFGGLMITLDPETRANITGAALGLMRCEDIDHIDWQIAPGQFVALPRDTVLAMADAAFRYVQACFSRARELSDLACAAANIDELAAIDLTQGWPQ